jgi:hypothetical protein
MSEAVRSVLLGTAGLSAAAAAAMFLTVTRRLRDRRTSELRSAVRLGGITVLLQAAHFAEECATGFQRRFPDLFGLPPWSARFFITFNLSWLAIWGLGLWGLAVRWQPALFPLWFLGIAGVANGVVHPLLSARTGGYFPGLFTSLLLGVAGILLLRRLLRVTVPRHEPPDERTPGTNGHERGG